MYKSKMMIIIIFSILLLAACGQNEKKLTKARKVEDFTFLKQNEDYSGLSDIPLKEIIHDIKSLQ